MLDELKTANKVVGIKQLRKALAKGQISQVFLAENADPALTQPVAELSESLGVPVLWAATMQELGAACQIAVGASAAGILRP